MSGKITHGCEPPLFWDVLFRVGAGNDEGGESITVPVDVDVPGFVFDGLVADHVEWTTLSMSKNIPVLSSFMMNTVCWPSGRPLAQYCAVVSGTR